MIIRSLVAFVVESTAESVTSVVSRRCSAVSAATDFVEVPAVSSQSCAQPQLTAVSSVNADVARKTTVVAQCGRHAVTGSFVADVVSAGAGRTCSRTSTSLVKRETNR